MTGELEAFAPVYFEEAGGGDVDWWQEYIRTLLGQAHDHYAAQVAGDSGEARLAGDEADAIGVVNQAHPAPDPVGGIREAIERLECRRAARERGAIQEARDMTKGDDNRAAYVAHVLETASCIVDYKDLAAILALQSGERS